MPSIYDEFTNEELDGFAKKEPVNTVNGKCSRCGNCCYRERLSLLPSEIPKIKKYIKTHGIQPCDHKEGLVKGAGLIDMACPFFDMKDKACTIYAVRPKLCEMYTCELNHNAQKRDAVFEKMNLSPEDAKWLLQTSRDRKEVNTGQLFFPDTYVPEPGDPVAINQLHFKMHMKHQYKPFIHMGETRTNHGITEALIVNPRNQGERLWFDIQGLTKIQII